MSKTELERHEVYNNYDQIIAVIVVGRELLTDDSEVHSIHISMSCGCKSYSDYSGTNEQDTSLKALGIKDVLESTFAEFDVQKTI